MDRNLSCIAEVSCGYEDSRQNSSLTFQELDVSIRTLVLADPQWGPDPGPRLELLQPVVLRGRLCELLSRAAGHVSYVFSVEDMEKIEDHQAQ